MILTARGASPSHADLIASWTSAPTAREYGPPFTVVRLTAPKFRIDQRLRDDVRVQDRIFWKKT
jgi:hypothetical protein